MSEEMTDAMRVAIDMRDRAFSPESNYAASEWDMDEAAAVIATALAEAERAQMERDCAAVCGSCGIGEELKRDDEWHHLFRGHLRNVCHASDIREAFAALHPEPEGSR